MSETSLTSEQLATLRQRLLDEQARLSANPEDTDITDQEQDSAFGASNHPAEEASDVFLRERNMALNENTADLLAEIDAALERMDHGTYGICERTGDPIPYERLEALPYARYTLEGQRQIEEERAR